MAMISAADPGRDPAGTEDAGFVALLEARIARHLADLSPAPQRLVAAARGAMTHGKRLRPCLLNHVAGKDADPDAVLDMAVAFEMVHSASLILDDLPAMDNALLRRGRPTTHVLHGEATAILAAIGLLNQAIAIANALPGVDAPDRQRLVAILTGVMGWNGLVAGQELDLNGFSPGDAGACDPQERICRVNRLKTGILLCAAVEAGALLGRRPEAACAQLLRFAGALGQAFQIADDLGDAHRGSDQTGKDCGKDAGKETFLAVFGTAEALNRCHALLAEADGALHASGIDARPLRRMVGAIVGPMLSLPPDDILQAAE